MSIISVYLTFDSDGDPYDRLYELARMCEDRGEWNIAEDITLGAALGLSPEDQRKIGEARELHVMDCVLPNGWAVLIGRAHIISDPSTYWTYAADGLAAVGAAPDWGSP